VSSPWEGPGRDARRLPCDTVPGRDEAAIGSRKRESIFHKLSTFVENEESTISIIFYVLDMLLSISSWNYVNPGDFLA
jgi:hypothetical protein